MIIATVDGLVAIRWEDEFWKQPFDWAYAGYLELQKIDNERLIVNYDCPDYEGQITLELLTGQKLG
ncbi:hypothetical protein [Candidatus Berkiella aquae]|uniref:Uncharacterized protein n=1 Tax=Candidatus Berkiella aquae TaxID=295108 RepID=A0A0Q9YV03_9GAMM|nr:hypothetical protein [Candidatus Berkiella aquae]MCS5710642.1 hypothetical protein [Candidatus Berkiella aquae]